jgi:hypothetical protein
VQKIRHNLTYLILAVLVIADGFITNAIIQSGKGYEGNSLLAGIAGTDKLIFVKVLGVILAIYILMRIARKRPLMAKITTLSFVALYTLIVGWNFSLWI